MIVRNNKSDKQATDRPTDRPTGRPARCRFLFLILVVRPSTSCGGACFVSWRQTNWVVRWVSVGVFCTCDVWHGRISLCPSASAVHQNEHHNRSDTTATNYFHSTNPYYLQTTNAQQAGGDAALCRDEWSEMETRPKTHELKTSVLHRFASCEFSISFEAHTVSSFRCLNLFSCVLVFWFLYRSVSVVRLHLHNACNYHGLHSG